MTSVRSLFDFMKEMEAKADQGSILQRVAGFTAKFLENGLRNSSPPIEEISSDMLHLVLVLKLQEQFNEKERAQAASCLKELVARMENIEHFEKESIKESLLNL
jgi:hypothetical protein